MPYIIQWIEPEALATMPRTNRSEVELLRYHTTAEIIKLFNERDAAAGDPDFGDLNPSGQRAVIQTAQDLLLEQENQFAPELSRRWAQTKLTPDEG